MKIQDHLRHAAAVAKAGGTRFVPKKMGRMQPALAIEIGYANALHRRVDALKIATQEAVGPRLKAILAMGPAKNVRQDDYTDEIDRALDLARAAYNGIAPTDEIGRTATEYLNQTAKFQKQQLQKILADSIGVNVFFGDKGLAARAKGFVAQNVDLISSIDEQYFGKLKQSMLTHVRKGDRVEVIRDEIEDLYDVSRSRASLIARDQVGKLYGELNRDRQTEIGVTQYTWRTVGDERVRGTPGGMWPNGMHYDLDGQVFTWGEPPVTNDQGDRNEPGGDYQCRCTAEPVLPKL